MVPIRAAVRGDDVRPASDHGRVKTAAIGVRVLLVALCAFGAFAGLERFDDKGFGWRLIAYPLLTLILPLVWRRLRRGRDYPYAADLLIVAPFLVDVVGNILNLYDTLSWWDDLNHFVNWALLSGGVGLLIMRLRLPRGVAAALIVGFGATAALLWEIGEYLAFIRTNTDELDTAYTDTLGDMSLGTLGSLVAALVVTAWAGRR